MSDSSNPLVRGLLARRQPGLLSEALAPKAPVPLPSSAIASALLGTLPPAPQAMGLSGTGGALGSFSLFGGILSERYRPRAQWEARFTHWERSPSDTETQQIRRARDMVRDALAQNIWLRSQGVALQPQGSFTNRTNRRNQADIDLRVQHPHIKIEFAPDVVFETAWAAGGYGPISSPLENLFPVMRSEIEVELVRRFGRVNVEPGSKAIRVKGLAGSRSEVDVVPAVSFHRVSNSSFAGSFVTVAGIAILSSDGQWTINYPEQHLANGRAKRLSTGHQFKRVVRIIKSLRKDMKDRGILKQKVPSFLIECLVYNVADKHFIVAGDDRYARVKRVLQEIYSSLNAGILSPYFMMEVNGIKSLFGQGQAWSVEDAQSFVAMALAHLGED